MPDGTLMQASRQWASRPADERFLSLIDLHDHARAQRDRARAVVRPNRALTFEAQGTDDLVITSGQQPATTTHWSFGQLAQLSGAPAGYLRDLPAPLAADCLNYGLRFKRDVTDVGLLIDQQPDGALELRAATGPQYGRVWNADIAGALVERFGDGVSGDWRVPGEFGKAVQVDKRNTTLYAGDRDMFVFLADEERRVEIADRRDGKSGSLARGFFVWNSEVGSTTLGAAFFLFDYACQNRIVWGARDYREVRIRHTSGAPHRWLGEVAPVLQQFSTASAGPIVQAIEAAKAAKVADDLDKFLADRQFTRSQIAAAKLAHEAEEGRPIETVWDAVTGLTAYARNVTWQDERVAIERRAGALLSGF